MSAIQGVSSAQTWRYGLVWAKRFIGQIAGPVSKLQIRHQDNAYLNDCPGSVSQLEQQIPVLCVAQTWTVVESVIEV